MVRIYTKDGCPYCAAAMDDMDASGVAYEEVNLSVHPGRIPEIEELTGRRLVPVVVQDDGSATSGWEGGG